MVFPQEPLLRVRGPVAQAMLLETPLLNIINFQTLIATKAARIALAARGEPVIEFGLRRAQGPDGALSASRAAFLGGCAATSNVLAGQRFGIPVRGTHAHSWVMLFDDELEAFQVYARAIPGNCTFLVDTYDTLPGVAHAIEVGRGCARAGTSSTPSASTPATSPGSRSKRASCSTPPASKRPPSSPATISTSR